MEACRKLQFPCESQCIVEHLHTVILTRASDLDDGFICDVLHDTILQLLESPPVIKSNPTGAIYWVMRAHLTRHLRLSKSEDVETYNEALSEHQLIQALPSNEELAVRRELTWRELLERSRSWGKNCPAVLAAMAKAAPLIKANRGIKVPDLQPHLPHLSASKIGRAARQIRENTGQRADFEITGLPDLDSAKAEDVRDLPSRDLEN